jgi:hypothetical protein
MRLGQVHTAQATEANGRESAARVLLFVEHMQEVGMSWSDHHDHDEHLGQVDSFVFAFFLRFRVYELEFPWGMLM